MAKATRKPKTNKKTATRPGRKKKGTNNEGEQAWERGESVKCAKDTSQ